MALNFSNNKYAVNIQTNQVNAEGYEVNNLIDNDLNVRKRGFRAEYFIRPPIDVVFTVDTSIDLMCIILGLKLNEHRVTGFELYFANSCDEKQFNFVAKHYCNTNADKVCVRNACYRPNGKLVDMVKPAMPSIPPDAEQINIASRYMRHCYDIKHIKLKIIKTINSTVPCLSIFDVWAQPNRNVSQKIITLLSSCRTQEISSNNNSFSFYGNSQQTNETQVKPNNKKRSHEKLVSREDITIPAEFIDPITCDIMSIPVLLPSGKNIDQTTLDRYLEGEAQWGRTANDPFTTIAFNSDSKPILNNVLKLRIDQFLSQNSECLSEESRPSKRIAGYSSMFDNLNSLRTSRLVFNEKQANNNSVIRSNAHCSECNESHDLTQHVLYKLSCSHVICRDQWLKKLNNTLQLTCSLCDSPILTKDVIKLQSQSI